MASVKSGFHIDIKELERRVKSGCGKVADKTPEATRAGGKVVLEGAKARAPEDTGAYVDDHKMTITHSSSGPTVTIYLDPKGKAAKYSAIVHEVPRELGERSRQKANSNGGRVVGHKNIERAMVEEADAAKAAVVKYLRGLFK